MNKFSLFSIITLLLVNITILNAEKNYLNIVAKHFEADKQNNVLYFEGDVNMTKNKDVLLCQSLVINTQVSPTDKTKQIPKDYKAIGDVSFVLHTMDNVLKGRGDVVYYYPDDKKYIIIGNGYLEDTKEGKKIIAEKIYIDELTGRTKIDGGKDKPIKFRLKLNDKSSPNDTNISKENSEKS
ncbi:MAG: lipopolysaccharide export system protein LptA [Arcobacteraceae bacterium]|jgi:lipopolysaccharide export system protein LptA